MQVKKVTLTNFRNYAQASTELWSERNILLGENAQGKSNFVEAIELLAKGASDRALADGDLIKSGATDMRVELTFQTEGRLESLALTLRRTGIQSGSSQDKITIEKSAQVNGVSYSSLKHLRGRLFTVSFKSEDLGLLRAGPKFRRDWIDQILLSLHPPMQDRLGRYQRAVAQRNRLLKSLFEKGKVNRDQQDELKVWDEQLVDYGSQIIKARLGVLEKLLVNASEYQFQLSEHQEVLCASYQLKSSQNKAVMAQDDAFDDDQLTQPLPAPSSPAANSLVFTGQQQSRSSVEVKELAEMLRRSFKESRYEEISRRQTLFGPHRDDISFFLSDKLATAFASQGQQRSLVLAMKLAELKLLSESLNEPPVLLLDDVLAELDLNRQALLMSLIRNDMQTIVTTTHISGFRPEWLEKAAFIYVKDGSLEQQQPDSATGDFCNATVELG